MGHNIHPDIPVRNDKEFKIVDIGSGTGYKLRTRFLEVVTDASTRMWLTDVNKELPLAHLHGFDKTVDGFPPRQWLPENVILQQLDIFEPIPETLIGQYDIVHVRLFMLVIQNDDPGPMLGNLVRLLSMFLPSRRPRSTEELLNTAVAGKFIRNQTAYKELTSLLNTTLEPGGYLMWVEHDPTNTRIESVSPELKSDAWHFIQGLSDGPRALR